jgi:putative membrane protein
MSGNFFNDWNMGWGWLLWLGFFFLVFSSLGNWSYTYRAHRRFDDDFPRKSAIDILNMRYAEGSLTRDEFNRMKKEIEPQSAKSA